jgi:hypothetical protein
MAIHRRKFFAEACGIGSGLLAGRELFAQPESVFPTNSGSGYKYRIAFELWINDVRDESMPLENWPYPVLDDKTVDGIKRGLDLQSDAGYNAIDLCGLFTTWAWPVDIKSVVDRERHDRITQILKAAHERHIKVICFPSGIMNWGFDEIIKQHPEIRTDNPHEMNPLREESWEWQYKVFEFVADNYDIDGFHLEAADQGRCSTKECMEKWPTSISYFTYVTRRLADYLRRRYPRKLRFATIQGFGSWSKRFNDAEKSLLVELSGSVNCIFDQGHSHTYIPQADWPEFIKTLHCDYGTSGGSWTYPPQRWDRTRWFLPYSYLTGTHIKTLYAAGGRGVMYYQGPRMNPSTEVNIAFGGLIMSNPASSVADVLAEVIERLYHPKTGGARGNLVEIYQRAESAYFGQWNAARIQAYQKSPPPGELYLTTQFGTSPGPATYLMEPYLDAVGRLAYKKELELMLKDVFQIEDQFEDNGRINRIKRSIEETLADINNIIASRSSTELHPWSFVD